MRKLFLSLVLLVGLLALGTAPALASYAPGLLIDWGESQSVLAKSDSVGLMVRLSNQSGLGGLYLDTGLDYGEDLAVFNLGLTIRSPRTLFIFRPYAGWGIAYDLTDLSPVWDVSPYMVFGSEFLWMYWEEEITLHRMDPGVITRAGIRIRF